MDITITVYLDYLDELPETIDPYRSASRLGQLVGDEGMSRIMDDTDIRGGGMLHDVVKGIDKPPHIDIKLDADESADVPDLKRMVREELELILGSDRWWCPRRAHHDITEARSVVDYNEMTGSLRLSLGRLGVDAIEGWAEAGYEIIKYDTDSVGERALWEHYDALIRRDPDPDDASDDLDLYLVKFHCDDPDSPWWDNGRPHIVWPEEEAPTA